MSNFTTEQIKKIVADYIHNPDFELEYGAAGAKTKRCTPPKKKQVKHTKSQKSQKSIKGQQQQRKITHEKPQHKKSIKSIKTHEKLQHKKSIKSIKNQEKPQPKKSIKEQTKKKVSILNKQQKHDSIFKHVN